MTEPPPAESGEVYESVDARCRACVVYGGPESKCIKKEHEELIYKPLGRECARVDLWPELSPEAEILEFVMFERLRPLAPLRAEVVADVYGLTQEELNDTLSRVFSVMGSSEIASLLAPEVPRG